MTSPTLQTYLIPQRFYLVRSEDESGVSGTGVVAVGVQWPSGHCSMEWIVEPHTQGWYEKLSDLKEVHGHDGKTIVHFVEEPYECVYDPDEERV